MRKRRERDVPGALLKLLVKATSQQRSTRERERTAAETPEERERRLQQMSTNQHERLAAEGGEIYVYTHC